MIVFPLIAMIVSLLCGLVIARDCWRRPRPEKIAWVVAFALFGIGAGAEVLASLNEWTIPLARVFYVSGAVLVVGYLALGQLYLLAGRRIGPYAPGLAMLVSAIAVTMVWNAPIDEGRLAEDGWDAIERGPALIALTVGINAIGTIVLAGGALYSAWRFRQAGIQRHRMIGCVLIAVGTVIVAMGGTLTRFGQHEYLYIAMALGVLVIFAGVLETRRSDLAGTLEAVGGRKSAEPIAAAARPARIVRLPSRSVQSNHDLALNYIEEHLLPLDTTALAAAAQVWSAAPRDIATFSRQEARQVWQLRAALSIEGRSQFDALPPGSQMQLAELWFEVFGGDQAERA